MKIIDDFLNGITMYRLMLYYLVVILLWALILCLFGKLPFTSPIAIVGSFAFITTVCWLVNKFFALIFKVPANPESFYITAFILCLIITPALDLSSLTFMFLAAVLAMASKFILCINRKHLFNPAAFGAFITGLVLAGSGGVTWWVSTAVMLPVVLLGGILIVKKIKKWDLLLSFLVVVLAISFILSFSKNFQPVAIFKDFLLNSPLIFFGFVMLTEPSTTPPNRLYRVIYGAIVAVLFGPQIHFGSFTPTPEMALLTGNIFSFLVSPKEVLLLKLKQKNQLSPDTYDFVFGLDHKINYLAGQYMEWTLASQKPDLRGARRYFTLASSPTEDTLRIGVKFYPNGSTFKKSLDEMPLAGTIVAAQLAGEFTLPKDPAKKLVFIAGGIGVTPFRSMIKYLLDNKESRDIVLIYSVKNDVDLVYLDLFNQAEKVFGLKKIINVSERMGMVTREVIARDIPDFKSRTFYLSGPHGMVDGFKKTLSILGVPGGQIKTDYFPGYA